MNSALFPDGLRTYQVRGDSNNVNVSSRELTNVIDIEKYTKSLQKSSREIDTLADQLVECFANPASRPYYCKVAMRLSEATIWNNVEMAKRGRSPARYFTWLCQKAMG